MLTFRLGLGLLALSLELAGTATSASAQTFVRMEVMAIETVTLNNQKFLTGDLNGTPTWLAGELRLPKSASARVPAVVLVHGSGGLGASTDRWAQELNAIGVATFILDSFTGRGIVTTSTDQTQLDSIAMMVDAYRALGRLAEHPRIEPTQIAVMGFSKGAVSAIYSSNERFRKLYAPKDTQFAAHIGLYTPCNVAFREDEHTTGKPIRMFHGLADNYVPIAPCQAYVERLKKAGADVALTAYPDAHHAYDVFTLAEPVSNPKGQTTRNCTLREGDNGVIVNVKSGQIYSLATDPCVELGPTVAYNAAAHEATVKAVREFLAATFKLGG